jgi:hypothetical protein
VSRLALGPIQSLLPLVPGALSSAVSGVKLAAHLHLVPRPRIVVLYICSPVCLYGVMLN